jgi:hypothetical protein
MPKRAKLLLKRDQATASTTKRIHLLLAKLLKGALKHNTSKLLKKSSHNKSLLLMGQNQPHTGVYRPLFREAKPNHVSYYTESALY